ncbi:MAG: multiple sugar transport system permease protein, partial [Pseudonocardiales bacterium]|nr:multiple sugar transport system permease protein [Pseudonocardiales bacterium]
MARELQPGQRRFSAATLGADLLLLAWFVFSLFPLVWLVLLSLKTEAQQISTYFTFTPTLHNFVTVLSSDGTRLTSVNFSGALLTSVLNCAGAVLVSLVIGVPAAYAAGRWQYRGSGDVMFTILSFRFAPELMVIVPLFVIYNQIGLFDTNVGMIWVLQLVTMPLIVWILRSYFQDLPAEL